MSDTLPLEALAKLRLPFEANHISQLPKPTKAQTEEVKKDFKAGIRCDICGTWHHPKVVHLSYVGHAAITHRLLDVDPMWTWEPVGFDSNGLPALDTDGGLWIKLTICGLTRIGYGDAQGKTGPDAMKERIGDALRNAAMRFGAALDLWHKGVLELEPDRFEVKAGDKWTMKAGGAATADELQAVWKEGVAEISNSGDRVAYDEFKAAVAERKAELQDLERTA